MLRGIGVRVQGLGFNVYREKIIVFGGLHWGPPILGNHEL